jgi:hypothetical protein
MASFRRTFPYGEEGLLVQEIDLENSTDFSRAVMRRIAIRKSADDDWFGAPRSAARCSPAADRGAEPRRMARPLQRSNRRRVRHVVVPAREQGRVSVPVFITEPAIGYGGGLVVAFFQQSIAELAAQSEDGRLYRPPNVYAAGGFGTENGTWGAFGGGMVTFHHDRWRWRGGGGYASVNLTYYGSNDAFAGRGLDYGLDGVAAVNHLLYRVGESHWWLAAHWQFLNLESAFDLQNTAIATLEDERRSSGVGPSIEYDSRDTIFTPGRGWTGSADMLFYAPAFGGDATFQTYRAHVFAYMPLAIASLSGRGSTVAARTATRRSTCFHLSTCGGFPSSVTRMNIRRWRRASCAGMSRRAGR